MRLITQVKHKWFIVLQSMLLSILVHILGGIYMFQFYTFKLILDCSNQNFYTLVTHNNIYN